VPDEIHRCGSGTTAKNDEKKPSQKGSVLTGQQEAVVNDLHRKGYSSIQIAQDLDHQVSAQAVKAYVRSRSRYPEQGTSSSRVEVSDDPWDWIPDNFVTAPSSLSLPFPPGQYSSPQPRRPQPCNKNYPFVLYRLILYRTLLRFLPSLKLNRDFPEKTSTYETPSNVDPPPHRQLNDVTLMK
jgi:hypothetical protein